MGFKDPPRRPTRASRPISPVNEKARLYFEAGLELPGCAEGVGLFGAGRHESQSMNQLVGHRRVFRSTDGKLANVELSCRGAYIVCQFLSVVARGPRW